MDRLLPLCGPWHSATWGFNTRNPAIAQGMNWVKCFPRYSAVASAALTGNSIVQKYAHDLCGFFVRIVQAVRCVGIEIKRVAFAQVKIFLAVF